MKAENLPHWYLLPWRKCAVFGDSIAFFAFALIPGTQGENRFGPEPRKA